jgi:hypothetical protein
MMTSSLFLIQYSVRKSEIIEAMGVPEDQWKERAVKQIDSALNDWRDALPSHRSSLSFLVLH